ncbi:MAG: YigZ family protein [Bacteroidota bacterium]|nr:YigZ family protein [Bacteroidota bacterium]
MPEAQDTYKAISDRSEGFFKDKGSKFYSFAFPVFNEEEVRTNLENIRKQFHDARHHCYAYSIGFDRDLFRINDDGEPSGTAGNPIHGQILSYDLRNVLIIVVRYFGGTKLGVRGLINAYKFAAQDAINNAKILDKKLKDVYELHYDYTLMSKVMYIIKEEKLEQLETKFEIDCKLKFSVRKKESKRILELFSAMYPLKIKYLNSI